MYFLYIVLRWYKFSCAERGHCFILTDVSHWMLYISRDQTIKQVTDLIVVIWFCYDIVLVKMNLVVLSVCWLFRFMLWKLFTILASVWMLMHNIRQILNNDYDNVFLESFVNNAVRVFTKWSAWYVYFSIVVHV